MSSPAFRPGTLLCQKRRVGGPFFGIVSSPYRLEPREAGDVTRYRIFWSHWGLMESYTADYIEQMIGDDEFRVEVY